MVSQFARDLRHNPTEAERRLWSALRNRLLDGYRVRRQAPIGPYVLDFVCSAKRLVIELDGGQHAAQQDHDLARTEWLSSHGFRVLRFWNTEVLQNTTGVLESIRQTLADETNGGA